MRLIGEIIDLLTTSPPDLSTALAKTKVLLHQLGEKELLAWVNWELCGYPDSADLPEYRILGLSIMGDCSNGVYRHTNKVLPVAHLDPSLRKQITTSNLTEGITAIERLSTSEDGIKATLPPEVYGELSRVLGNGYMVESAWGVFQAGAMSQALGEIRSRLLDFLLELSDRIPQEMSTSELREHSEEFKVSEIFNNAVFGPNATIIVGNRNTQNVEQSVIKRDFASLDRFIEEIGICDADRAALRAAIERDEAEPGEDSMGTAVRAWMADMLAKAGTAAWSIKVSAAGALLTKALEKYFGL